MIILVLDEREGNMKAACLGNQRALATALQLYLSDWGEFPVAHRWCDQLSPYVAESPLAAEGGAFRCPAAANQQCSYALNSALSGVKAAAVARENESSMERTVGIFESDVGWNSAGGPGLLPDRPRHIGGDNYAFPDGHAAWFARKRLPDGSRANLHYSRTFMKGQLGRYPAGSG